MKLSHAQAASRWKSWCSRIAGIRLRGGWVVGLLAFVLWIAPGRAAEALSWDTVYTELVAVSGAPQEARLKLLLERKREGAPWKAVDRCRFAAAEVFLRWGMGDLEAAARVAEAGAADAAREAEKSGGDLLAEGWHCHLEALRAFIHSDHEEASRQISESVKRLRQAEEPRDLASALSTQAEIAGVLADLALEEASWTEARRLYAETGDRLQTAVIDIILVEFPASTPEEQEAREKALFAALETFRELGHRPGLINATITMAQRSLLPPAQVLAALEEVRPLAGELGDVLSQFEIEQTRAFLYEELGEFDEAVAAARRALILANVMGDRDYHCWATIDLGRLLLKSGQPEAKEQAATFLREGLSRAQANGDRHYEGLAQAGLARIDWEAGEIASATVRIDAALELLRPFGPDDEFRDALDLGARLAAANGDDAAAIERERQAYELALGELTEARAEARAEASGQFENELRSNAEALSRVQRELTETRLREQSRALEMAHARQSRDRWMRNSSLVGAALALIAAVVFGVLFRQRRAAQKRAEALNDALGAETAALAREVARHEESNRELTAANLRLKFLDEERKSILGMAAHDMRNPAGSIHTALEMLEDELARGDRANRDQMVELVELAKDGTGMLLELIERIVAVRRQQDLAVDLDMRAFDPRELLLQTIQLNQSAAQKKEMRIVLKEAQPVRVEADPQSLRTSIDNLLSNAVKYSFHGAQIRVFLRRGDDGRAEIAVEDGGPGIPEEEFGKLFQPFALLSNRPTGGERSSGLGLCSVKAALEAMGGSVRAENLPGGKGARFTLELKRAEEAGALHEPAALSRRG